MFLLPMQYIKCSMEITSAIAKVNIRVSRTLSESQSLLLMRQWMGDEATCDFLLEYGTNDLADAVRHKHQMKSLIRAKSNRN